MGWAYENWLQENFGVEDDTPIEIEEEEEEIESFDVDSLKPGINLHKIKIADWKVMIQNLQLQEFTNTFSDHGSLRCFGFA